MNTTTHSSFFSPAYFREIGGRSLVAAEVVVPMLLPLVAPASVIDVGCGTGAWLAVLRQHGAREVLGLDGDYVRRDQLLIEPGSFQSADLAQLPAVDRTFDLAISLEAAQYVSPTAGEAIVPALCRWAPVVLFSSAVPGQPGDHHANARFPSYWMSLFAKHDYVALDPFRAALWHDERIALHYRQNLLLYVRRDVLEGPQASEALRNAPRANCLTLIDMDSALSLLGWRGLLRRLPAELRRLLRREPLA